MKLSMYMILERLEKYRPSADIHDGAARITALRMTPELEAAAQDPGLLHMSIDVENGNAVTLMNGEDTIALPPGTHPEDVVNDLLDTFAFFDEWERGLKRLAEGGTAQEIVDWGTRALGNPAVLSDVEGNVLAMSSAFLSEDINEYWVDARQVRRLPIGIVTSPKYTEDGAPTIWTEEPRIYNMLIYRTVGAYIAVDGERVAGIALWQHRRTIQPSDTVIVKYLCEALSHALANHARSTGAVTIAAIVSDLLAGREVDGELVAMLVAKCPSPWRLILVDNRDAQTTKDEIALRRLLYLFQGVDPTSMTQLYENHVVTLISEDKVDAVVNSLTAPDGERYSVISVSLPFDELRLIRARYAQVRYVSQQADGQAGLYRGEDYALPYLLEVLVRENDAQSLGHPLLRRLRDYDEKKNTELYDTLYQYLKHERSVRGCAEAMNIHKNTMLYRLERINDIEPVDLDDPVQRLYLLLSYLMEML